MRGRWGGGLLFVGDRSKMKWKVEDNLVRSVCQREQQWLYKRGCYVFICFDFIVLVRVDGWMFFLVGAFKTNGAFN